MVESQYHDLQEEVEDMRKLIRSFRVRYKQAIQEIKDLNQEHCKERQDLFQNCQDLERDMHLYRDILLKGFISDSDLQNLIQKCTYNEDKKVWVVPRFTLNNSGLPVFGGASDDQSNI